MPFTISHVAAVVPGYRPLSRRQVFSAAVIGSMVPDFGMLLPGTFARWQTHSVHALVSFCLPVGLAAYLLTQVLLKPAIIEVAPPAAYARLRAAHPAVPLGSLRHWLQAAGVLLLGAATHLIWDAFTHEDGRGARMFPVLGDYGPEMDGHPMHFYRWAQYASSVFGLLVVIGALALWLRGARVRLQDAPAGAAGNPAERRLGNGERRAWMLLYLALPVAALAWGIVRPLSHGFSPFVSGASIGHVAVLGMRALALSLLGVSAAIRLRLA